MISVRHFLTASSQVATTHLKLKWSMTTHGFKNLHHLLDPLYFEDPSTNDFQFVQNGNQLCSQSIYHVE